jgi:hypothetical protein
LYAVNEQDPGVKLQVSMMHFSPSHCLWFSSILAWDVRSCNTFFFNSEKFTEERDIVKAHDSWKTSKVPVEKAEEVHLVVCASSQEAPSH